MNVRPLRIATVITRLEGGAGVLALRGAKALDPDEFQVTIITGSGSQLLDEAATAGLDVIIEPALRTRIDPRIGRRCRGRRGDRAKRRHQSDDQPHPTPAIPGGKLVTPCPSRNGSPAGLAYDRLAGPDAPRRWV